MDEADVEQCRSAGFFRAVWLCVPMLPVFTETVAPLQRKELEWIADNPFYTKRFAYHVGRRCRNATVKEVAKEHHLRWHTIKELEKQYMHKQLEVAGTPTPRVIGIDEISVRKGHSYRIVVSDLERRVPIWFGGTDRSEKSLDEFYVFLGEKSSKNITLAAEEHLLVSKALPISRAPYYFCACSDLSL